MLSNDIFKETRNEFATFNHDVEVIICTGYVGESPFFTHITKPFSQLLKGEEFRIKIDERGDNYCYDNITEREHFICKDNAKYDTMKGWYVEIE